jgi:hypothetical protein
LRRIEDFLPLISLAVSTLQNDCSAGGLPSSASDGLGLEKILIIRFAGYSCVRVSLRVFHVPRNKVAMKFHHTKHVRCSRVSSS